jgi:hypothetical protein
MPQSVILSIEPSALQLHAGSRTIARLTMRNNSQSVGQYQLRVQGIDPNWVRIEPDQLGIFPGTEAAASLRFNIPQGVSPATYRVIVIAVSQTDQPDQAQATLALTVQGGSGEPTPIPRAQTSPPASPEPIPPSRPESTTAADVSAPISSDQKPTPVRATSPGAGQLEVLADRGSVTLLPGAQERINLNLRNAGGSAFTIEVGVKGPPGEWLSLTQSSLLLAPAQSASITLTLSPPPAAPTGSYPLSISVQSRDDLTVQVELDLVLEIAEPGELTVELMPPQAEGQVSAEFQLRIAQGGGTPLRVSLSASDDDVACNYTFNPTTLELPPHGSANTRLTVSARQGLAGVDSRTFLFTVMATTAEGATAMSKAQGRFIQRHTPPLELSLNPIRQSGPGAVTFSIRIGNPSEVPAAIRLSANDPDGACRYQFDTASLTVPALGEGKAILTVTPVDYHSGPGNKTYTFSIRADPAGGILLSAQSQGTFVQTAMERPVLSLTPSSQSTSGPAAFTLQVTNPRPTPMQVQLKADDASKGCEFTVNPPQLTLAPHGQATARLTVRPTTALFPGEARRTYEFNVQAQATDLPEPTQVEGSLVQVRGFQIAPLLPFLAAGILVLLVCLAFVVLGPPLRNFLSDAFSKVASVQIPTSLPPVTPLPPPTSTPTLTPTPTPSPTVSVPTITSLPIPTQTPIVVTGVPPPTTPPTRTATPVPFMVTGVTAGVAPTSSAICPSTFNFSATISANQAGTATYRWERSDGAHGPNQNVAFSGPGTQMVTTSWTLSAHTTGWERVHILAPNSTQSNMANFTLNCPVVVYDLIAKANLANWESGSPVTNLSFGGSDSDPNGFVLWRNNFTLNDGSQPPLVLETHPKWVDSGFISGAFTDIFFSGYSVQASDTISGKVGFISGAGAGNVTFKVMIRPQGGSNTWIVTIPLAYADGVKPFNQPLGAYAGRRADFILEVDANNHLAGQDWAVWQDVKIIR